ncbi:D-ribose pyranase [Oceanobacillus kimchii]|uniref:D-ribose pyranase n=1 Tax=Oceanobacillus kimchii TaxID=746691 RepID=UPI000346D926|nr:D-ribose pyranase [Oceanobacillus kimchii]
MKKKGMLNSHISKLLSDLGHTDQIVIADAGLPVPEGVKKIDVALTPGTPSFIEVLNALIDDMVIEEVTLAQEIKVDNTEKHKQVKELINDTPISYVTHEQFKSLNKQAKAIIRTGETTPYANCILRSGVFF